MAAFGRPTLSKRTTWQRLLFLRLDRELVVDRDEDGTERRSAACDKRGGVTAELVAAECRVLVVRCVDHHVWMPCTEARSRVLARGPHVCESGRCHFRQL